jgi:amino acid transporter
VTGDDAESGAGVGSITLTRAVAMGTGVMIGAGIFALTGQVAALAGPLFPLAFIAGAVVTAFSSYSYIKMASAEPSSGGIAMILQKCYGPAAVTAGASLLMALSMVIAESLVARTFAAYALQPFNIDSGPLIPILALAVIGFAFVVNVAGNRAVGLISLGMAAVKIGGIALFGIAALWSSGFSFAAASKTGESFGPTGFIASVALAILAFKGFTTITNDGGEITEPHRNVARAITISIVLCIALYLLVALGVGSSLTIDQIVAARDYALAEAAEPALGQVGFGLTVVLAVLATASAVIASIFAVSRMLAMLTEMHMIPHSHLGMPGPIQRHTLVYTVVIAAALAVLFDISRIASLGAFLYLIMDMLVHWGIWRFRRREVGAYGPVLLTALSLDAAVLTAFVTIKLQNDPTIVLIAALAIFSIFAFSRIYLHRWIAPQQEQHQHH